MLHLPRSKLLPPSVDDFNTQLQTLCQQADKKSKGRVGVQFLKFQGLKENHPDTLRDGLHLTTEAFDTYWRIMRRTVIKEVKKARPMREQDLAKYQSDDE